MTPTKAIALRLLIRTNINNALDIYEGYRLAPPD